MELAHRLVSTRRGTIALSALSALVAGTLIVVYVNRYRSSVKAEGASVTVLVARTAIAKGTPGEQVAAKGLFTVSTVAQKSLREGALSDPSSLTGRVTAHDVYQGQQLTAADFAPAGTSLTSELSGSQRIVSIPIDSARGLLGAIKDGDHVDVYVGFNVQPVDSAGAPATTSTRPVVRLAMQDVDVVAVTGEAGGNGTGDVTLKVTAGQAAKLAFASDNGKVWLALRPSSGATAPPPDVVSAETLLLGIPPVKVLESLGGRP